MGAGAAAVGPFTQFIQWIARKTVDVRRPAIEQGGTDWNAGDGAYNATLLLTNRARRGFYSAQVIRAQLIGEDDDELPGAPSRVPWSLPWVLPSDWTTRISNDDARHQLVRGQSARLFLGRIDVYEGRTFWLVGVPHHQPYAAGRGIKGFELGLRVLNQDSDQHWEWSIIWAFDPDTWEPRITVEEVD